MIRMMALLGLLAMQAIAASDALKGTWKVTYKEAASTCANPAAI